MEFVPEKFKVGCKVVVHYQDMTPFVGRVSYVKRLDNSTVLYYVIAHNFPELAFFESELEAVA